MITVNNLHKYFDKNEVLKGINSTIKKGECVVVILDYDGSSGVYGCSVSGGSVYGAVGECYIVAAFLSCHADVYGV